MKTVYLLRYSQLTQSNMMESVKAFIKHTGIEPKIIQIAAHMQGGSPLSAYKPEEIERVSQGAIYLYKTGKIDDLEFVARMNHAMGINLSLETFKKCWNAMCTVQPETLELLHQLERIQNEDAFGIHVMGNTNSMQANYISEQFEAAGLKIRMTHTFSFEAGMLDPTPPKTTDAGWEDVNIVDLRDTVDILAEINKPSTESSLSKAPKCKLSLD